MSAPLLQADEVAAWEPVAATNRAAPATAGMKQRVTIENRAYDMHFPLRDDPEPEG